MIERTRSLVSDADVAALTDAVPLALRERRQWVCWSYVTRDGKRTKCPMNARTGRRAKSTDPETWSSFDVAVAAWQARADYAGIGFVFSDDGPYAGVDLDECMDEGGNLAPSAREVIASLNSYAEVSPSGRGVKVFVIGQKPENCGCKSREIDGYKETEVYSKDRFFAVTGQHLNGTPRIVEPRQAELDALCRRLWPPAQENHPPGRPSHHSFANISDDELIERASNAANGDKFKRLWNGDTSEYGGDESRADLALADILTFWANGEASTIDRLFRRSRLFRPKWDRRSGNGTYGQRTIAKALAGKSDFYSPKVSLAVDERCGANRISSAIRSRASLLTDVGNAARLVVRYGDRIRYCHGTGLWYVWDKTHWRTDDRGRIVDLCKQTSLSILNEAKKSDEQSRPNLVKWAMTSQKRERLSAMAALAQPDVAVSPRELDADPFLFNCRNGTLDLRTGQLRKHDPQDMLTKLAPVEYDPASECPLFDRFVEETFCGDVELIEYVDRWHGHCLTADVREQYLPIYMGDGNNGKSVLLDTIAGLMGPYAGEAPPDLLTVRKHPEHPTEIADLFGMRLVIASETERDAELRLQLIKRLTGNAKLKGRRMREDYFEFDRTHKLVLVTNNLPRVKEDTEAAWRRLRLVPFNFVVPAAQRDPLLLTKLQAEWSGIFARLAAGCQRWLESGLSEPTAISMATGSMRGKVNSFLGFMADRCSFAPAARCVTSVLRDEYAAWCLKKGAFQEDSKSTAALLRSRGCTDRKHKGDWHWFGVTIRSIDGHVGQDGRDQPHGQDLAAHEAINGRTTSSMSITSSEEEQ